MDTVSMTIGVSWTVAGLIIIGLAIPLVLRRIGPNNLYGIRLPQSLQSEDAWYAINSFGGKRMIVWAAPILLVGFATFFLRLKANTGLTLVLGFAPLIFVLMPAFESWRFAQKFQLR